MKTQAHPRKRMKRIVMNIYRSRLNIDQSGFYRVEYEDKLAARLRKAVERNYLSEVDKYGVHNVQ